MNKDYSVEIVDSNRELTNREILKLKMGGDAISIDKATTENGTLDVVPVDWAMLSIHNEKSDNKDYKQLVVIDKDGTHYYTGSESCAYSFFTIDDAMKDETEPYTVRFYRSPSKNRPGKDYLNCELL